MKYNETQRCVECHVRPVLTSVFPTLLFSWLLYPHKKERQQTLEGSKQWEGLGTWEQS